MMSLKEAKKIFLNRGYIEVSGGTYYDADKWRESIIVISKWLEQGSCEDCISRQEAILQIQQYGVGCFDAEEFSPEQCERFVIWKLNELSSVTPEEKTGTWIDDEFGSKCSRCGTYTHLDKFDRPMKFKYCSMCGAKMEAENEKGK